MPFITIPTSNQSLGFPVVKNQPANAADVDSIPGSERCPGIRNSNPLVFLPGKFHGQRSLEGDSPWGQKDLDMTEHTAHRL